MKSPSPQVYDDQLRFMPYIKSLEIVRDIVCADAPKNAHVLDLMCGTGYLAREIAKRRGDLAIEGIDTNKKYMQYAASLQSENMLFEVGDILKKSLIPSGVVLCTGALHHIPYVRQEEAIEKIANLTNPKGFAIISDCYIDDFQNERQRQLAAAKLGYKYLKATVENGAPADIIEATVDILRNDVSGLEFKTSLQKRLPILGKYFKDVKTIRTWAESDPFACFLSSSHDCTFGDYIHILRK
jgi:SAM-dependent methyltransferase